MLFTLQKRLYNNSWISVGQFTQLYQVAWLFGWHNKLFSVVNPFGQRFYIKRVK